jgi:ectoine hydroxylase
MTEHPCPSPSDLYPTRKATEPALLYRTNPVVYGGEGPVDDATLAAYEENGFLTVEELLKPDEVEGYRVELRRLAADEAVRRDARTMIDRGTGELLSIFEVHKVSEVFAELVRDPRLVDRARQILGSDVYVHQTRVNHIPAFSGEDRYWHSDFEVWHAVDGMPRMRALSVSIALTENFVHNGALMIMPGSHKTFVSCVAEIPAGHYRDSPRDQRIGTPDPDSLSILANKHGIEVCAGPPGSATVYDCNCMHGSNGNITPFPRSNVFIVFNSVENACKEPFAAPLRRPEYVAARDFTPVGD